MQNKVITIYELMGLIKDGQAPKKIKYNGTIYEFKKGYYFKNNNTAIAMFDFRSLNNTVEILSEGNDEWEDIEEIKHDGKKIYNSITNIYNKLNSKEKNIFIPILNQLIKNQKYLKEKLESKDEQKTKS